MTETGAPSPHAAYDRYMERQRRWGVWWRRFGQLTSYVIGIVLALVIAAIFTAGVLDLWQPRIWGTFTETGCEPRPRGGCRPVGTWISDDRSVVKRDIYLDGWTGTSGTTRASYQPTAIISDESNNVVHAPLLTGAGAWLMGVVLIGWVGYMLYKAASWGDIVLPSRRRGSRPVQVSTGSSSLTTRGSPRRRYRRMLRQGTSSSNQGGDDRT